MTPEGASINVSGFPDLLRAMEELRRQIARPAMASYRYQSIEEFLLERGQAFAPAALDPEELAIVKRAVRMMGEVPQIRQCFYNAQLLAASDDTRSLHYVEGKTWRTTPIQHAWCEINGKVVDVTIREDPWKAYHDRTLPWAQWTLGTFDPENRQYWGVVFPDTASIVLGRQGPGEPLIDDWRAGWPVLKTGAGYGLPDAPERMLEEERP